MDKNKWIEEKVKELQEDYVITHGDLGIRIIPIIDYTTGKSWQEGLTIASFLRQSLEECWEKAQEYYHELEIVTEHRSLDEVLKPEHIDIKPLLECKPKKTLLNQSK